MTTKALSLALRTFILYAIDIYKPMTYNTNMKPLNLLPIPQTIVELTAFIKASSAIWSEEEKEAFIFFIGSCPLAGTVIPGCHGIRKVRWSIDGTGKRGGARVIYYYYDNQHPIFLMAVYSKNEKIDLSSEEKKILNNFIAQIKKNFQKE
jgi:hypothetical protein